MASAPARHQPEPDGAHRLDQVGLELLAQRCDVDVERLGRAPPVLVPHVVHQLLSALDGAGVGGQVDEQVVLLGRQADGVTAVLDAPRPPVDASAHRRRSSMRSAGSASAVVRRATARIRATSSRKPNGLTT